MYDHLAQAYVRLLRQTSPQAARCVEKIDAQYGTEAAVRAAFSLVLTMRCLRREGQLPEITTLVWGDTFMPGDREGAQALYDHAENALVADLAARR